MPEMKTGRTAPGGKRKTPTEDRDIIRPTERGPLTGTYGRCALDIPFPDPHKGRASAPECLKQAGSGSREIRR